MKWKIEKKYIRIGIVALCVIILALLFNYTLEHREEYNEFRTMIKNTLFPIVIGFALAYLQNPVLNFFEHYIFTPLGKLIFKEEKDKKKFSRGMGIVFTMTLFLFLVIGGMYLVIPQVYQSLLKIVTDAPSYYAHLSEWIRSVNKKNSEVGQYILLASDKIYSQAIDYLNNDILPNMDKIVAGITSGIVGGLKLMLNVILAVIISIYVLLEKEVLVAGGKKLAYSFFETNIANQIIRGVRYMDQVFGGFISGKIIDSFIIGLICYIFMTIAQFDYPVLISIVIGVTNIIPYFGPFIGAIPSAIILLMTDVRHGIIFVIFVLILQQVDGNIIGPVILGDRLNLSSMWILFAILVGGGFFGVPGMILGAPCFACLYALVGTICRTLLTKKKLPLDSEEYYDVDYIRPDSRIPVPINHEPVKKGTAIFSFDKYKKEEAAKKKAESEKIRKEEERRYKEEKRRKQEEERRKGKDIDEGGQVSAKDDRDNKVIDREGIDEEAINKKSIGKEGSGKESIERETIDKEGKDKKRK